MKTINTRAMMEGAVLAALMAIMGCFYNVPIVGIITLFWPVPVIIIGYRNGFKISILAALIAAIIVSAVATPMVGVILFSVYAIPGAVMGNMMRKKVSPYMTIGVCGILLALAAILEFVLGLELILGTDIVNIVSNYKEVLSSYDFMIQTQINDAVNIYRQLGFDEETLLQARESINNGIKIMLLFMPSALPIITTAISLLIFKLVTRLLERMGYKIEGIRRFSEWRFGKGPKYLLLITTFAVLLMMSMKAEFLYSFYMNVFLVLLVIFALLGMSVLSYLVEKLAEKYAIPKPVRRLLLVILLLLTLWITPYIGMFDIAADIRRFDRNIPGGAK